MSGIFGFIPDTTIDYMGDLSNKVHRLETVTGLSIDMLLAGFEYGYVLKAPDRNGLRLGDIKLCGVLVRHEHSEMLERYFHTYNITYEPGELDWVTRDRVRYSCWMTEDERKELQTFLNIVTGDVK